MDYDHLGSISVKYCLQIDWTTLNYKGFSAINLHSAKLLSLDQIGHLQNCVICFINDIIQYNKRNHFVLIYQNKTTTWKAFYLLRGSSGTLWANNVTCNVSMVFSPHSSFAAPFDVPTIGLPEFRSDLKVVYKGSNRWTDMILYIQLVKLAATYMFCI